MGKACSATTCPCSRPRRSLPLSPGGQVSGLWSQGGTAKATLMAPKMSQNWQSFPLPMPIQCIAEQGFPSLGCLTIPGAEG